MTFRCFHSADQNLPYFYLRCIWPNDHKHVSHGIIFTKFEVGQPISFWLITFLLLIRYVQDIFLASFLQCGNFVPPNFQSWGKRPKSNESNHKSSRFRASSCSWNESSSSTLANLFSKTRLYILQNLSLPVTFVPCNFRSLERSLPYCLSYRILKWFATKNLHRPRPNRPTCRSNHKLKRRYCRNEPTLTGQCVLLHRPPPQPRRCRWLAIISALSWLFHETTSFVWTWEYV